jgi:hypothetical protein
MWQSSSLINTEDLIMRKLVIASIAGLAIVASAVSLPASAEDGKLAVGVTGGTLGLGPEISWRFSEHVGLRANGGFYDYDDTDDLDDIEYDAKLKLNSFGAMLDWYPFGGGFRLSVGGRINNNEIDLEGSPTTLVEIGDVEYTPAEVGTLSGTVTTDSIAPAFTLGYGGRLAKGFTFSLELGVMLQGSPKINDLTASGTLANNPAFIQQLAIEEQRAEDDAHDFKLWPIIQIGLLYRF